MVWWHAATLFIYFYINRVDIQCFIYTTPRVPSCCPHGFRSAEGLLWGAEPRFELGPAVQQVYMGQYEVVLRGDPTPLKCPELWIVPPQNHFVPPCMPNFNVHYSL
jgi:hypothetical protein